MDGIQVTEAQGLEESAEESGASGGEAGVSSDAEERPAGSQLDGDGDAIEGVRELILKAHPDIVPDLLAGDSIEALLASVPAAREAYVRIAATIEERAPAPARIPTGSGRRPAVDPEGLSPESLIRAGLRQAGL